VHYGIAQIAPAIRSNGASERLASAPKLSSFRTILTIEVILALARKLLIAAALGTGVFAVVLGVNHSADEPRPVLARQIEASVLQGSLDEANEQCAALREGGLTQAITQARVPPAACNALLPGDAISASAPGTGFFVSLDVRSAVGLPTCPIMD
jgi:hypothetical protein